MNIKRLFILLGLLLSLSLTAQNYGNYKLYASYNFETDANDAQANTNLELKTGASITDDAARGKVLSFDGSAHGHAVFTPAPVVGDTLSLSFWFKRSSSDDTSVEWKQIFEFHNTNDDSNIYLMPVYGFDAGKSGLVCATNSFRKGIWESMTGPIINADNSWHHIVVVISGTNWNYYLDGTLAASKNIFGSLAVQAPTQLYLGMNPNRGTHPMTSSVDDVNVYHYPLSQSQVLQIYNGEAITEPTFDTPVTFHFDGDLNEEYNRINITGTGYSFSSDMVRSETVSLSAGGQLNFSENIIPEGASTINFLYKKESYSSEDNGKYIYQCSDGNNNSYGLKLKVDGDAYLVLETYVNGTQKETTGSKKLVAGKWHGISIFHNASSDTGKGTMRIYQDGAQTVAASQVQTYISGFTQWSLGSTTAAQSAGGMYDELIIENYAMSTNEISSYYLSNTTAVELTVDFSTTHQTIRNFGASDAWNSQLIGLHWPEDKKNRLAELLFSKEFDNDGNPKGIGLSCWRFNIGSGSAEQGDNSYISAQDKRTECFLNTDLSTYDWEKQKGQQWFLRKAVLDYGVEDVVGFMNSPPVYYTKNGLAFNKGGGWSYILKTDKYADFAKFTADVIEHFDSEGIHFDYISPVNEPQYEWRDGSEGTSEQEGTPATNTEIANVVKAMSTEFAARNLTTQLFIGEAGAIGSAVPQVPKFWGNEDAALKVAGLPNVSNIVSSHSYWNDDSAENMYNTRVNFRNTLNNTDPNLEYFQTEYSLLGGGYTWGHPGGSAGNFSEIECAMSLARMLHVDLAVAEATGWHWWTVFEQGNHLGESRFALIEALTTQDLNDGIYNDTKLLYTLGQYSRFVRPGMKRATINRSDNVSELDALKAQMYSAYVNEETNQVVIVAVNSDVVKNSIKLSVNNLPVNAGVQFTPYVTSADDDLKAYPVVKAGETFVMPALSVVTFVSELTAPSNLPAVENEVIVRVYPNPAVEEISISSSATIKKVMIYDIQGKMLKQNNALQTELVNISLTDMARGIYILSIETEKGTITEKLLKK